jgi:hypothetical protein
MKTQIIFSIIAVFVKSLYQAGKKVFTLFA